MLATERKTSSSLTQLRQEILRAIKAKHELKLPATPPRSWEPTPDDITGMVKVEGMLVDYRISIYGPHGTAAGLDWGFCYSFAFTRKSAEYFWDTFQGWMKKNPETGQWENFVA